MEIIKRTQKTIVVNEYDCKINPQDVTMFLTDNYIGLWTEVTDGFILIPRGRNFQNCIETMPDPVTQCGNAGWDQLMETVDNMIRERILFASDKSVCLETLLAELPTTILPLR